MLDSPGAATSSVLHLRCLVLLNAQPAVRAPQPPPTQPPPLSPAPAPTARRLRQASGGGGIGAGGGQGGQQGPATAPAPALALDPLLAPTAADDLLYNFTTMMWLFRTNRTDACATWPPP